MIRSSSDNKNDAEGEDFALLEGLYHPKTAKGKNRPLGYADKLKAFFDNRRIQLILTNLVIIACVGGLVYGAINIKNFIGQALVVENTESSEAELALSANTEPDLLGLREKDTDQDGISDYDELYIHQTSPYLPDSDSDGLKDFDEIAKGTDPNCPAGKDCAIFYPESESSSSDDILLAGEQVQTASTTAAQLAELEQLESEASVLALDQVANMPASDIRKLLADAGVSSEMLASISDQDLLRMVSDTISENPLQ